MPGSPHQVYPKPWVPLSTRETVVTPSAIPGARPPSCPANSIAALYSYSTSLLPAVALGTSAHTGHHEETRQRERTWGVQASSSLPKGRDIPGRGRQMGAGVADTCMEGSEFEGFIVSGPQKNSMRQAHFYLSHFTRRKPQLRGSTQIPKEVTQ